MIDDPGASSAASPLGSGPVGTGTCGHDSHCITCGDEAVPVRVVEVQGDGLALCEDGSTIETALVAPVERGEVLLVHAGTAIARAA